MPRITLGLPVYNGAALIGECLRNLAAQTHRDFEVIISDNGSTDGTTEICAEFSSDRRFRHVIHPTTRSANDNFLFVRDAADCDYFAYRAYDDLADPDFLDRLAPILEAMPGARLAVGTVRQELGGEGRVRLHRYPLTPAADHGPAQPRILRAECFAAMPAGSTGCGGMPGWWKAMTGSCATMTTPGAAIT